MNKEEKDSDLKDDILYEISKEEFYNFLCMQDIITDTIEERTKELSMILHNRLPIGEMCDGDIEEYTPGCGYIFVEFEEYHCGESCRDQFDLPIRFLYDKDYSTIYKKEFDEKIRLKNEMKEIEKVYERVKLNDRLERYDICEYERLKVKYE